MPTHVGILKFITSTYFMLVRVEPGKRFISTGSGIFYYQLINHPSEQFVVVFLKNNNTNIRPRGCIFSCSTQPSMKVLRLMNN